MSSISFDKHLPQSLVIKSVDNELYRIGCLCRSANQRKSRNLFHHPIVVNIALMIQLIKSIISFISDSELLSIYLGDVITLTGIGYNGLIVQLFFVISCLSLHLIHYNNDRRGVDPTFLRVLQLMSGSLTPREIGLTDRVTK